MEQTAELAYSKAQCLIHDADTENRRVKPLPFLGDADYPVLHPISLKWNSGR